MTFTPRQLRSLTPDTLQNLIAARHGKAAMFTAAARHSDHPITQTARAADLNAEAAQYARLCIYLLDTNTHTAADIPTPIFDSIINGTYTKPDPTSVKSTNHAHPPQT